MYMQPIDEVAISLLRTANLFLFLSLFLVRSSRQNICQAFLRLQILRAPASALARTRGRRRVIFTKSPNLLVFPGSPRLSSKCPCHKSESGIVCVWRSLSNMIRVSSKAPGNGIQTRFTYSGRAVVNLVVDKTSEYSSENVWIHVVKMVLRRVWSSTHFLHTYLYPSLTDFHVASSGSSGLVEFCELLFG